MASKSSDPAPSSNSIKAPPPPAPPADAAPPPHRMPAFLEKVETWIKGKANATQGVSHAIIEDLRTVAAEQDELRKALQTINETVQKTQAGLLQAQGRADALLQVLHRLEDAGQK